MPAHPHHPRSSLPLQLASADRVWQGDRAKRFFGASVKWLVLMLAILFGLDLIFHLPSWARLTGTALLGMSIAGVLVTMFWIALLSQSPLERIARILESRAPKLGSKLINIIQLQGQIEDESLPDATRALARTAVEQADQTLTEFPLNDIARTPMKREQILAALLPLAAVLIIGLLFFRITTNQALRFLDPFGDHPPFAFTSLKIITPENDHQSVVYKGNTVVEVEWTGHDPRDLYLTTWDPADKAGTSQTVPMIRKTENSFVQQLESVTSNLVAVAHNKDRRARSNERSFQVLLTPQITESKVAIALPEYTRRKAREIPYHYKTLQTLDESQLTFSISSNRPLSGGEITVATSDGETSRVQMTPHPEEPETVVGSIMARSSAKLTFVVKDITGISSEEELTGGLTVTNDLPPFVRIAEPYTDSFIVINHELTASFETGDDYGVASLRLHRALNDTYSPPRTFVYDDQPKRQVQNIPFHLPELGVEPGDVISFFAEAIDNAPEPHLTRSETRHLIVISEEEYNEQRRTQTDLSMVQEKFENLQDEFDELVDEQERISEEFKDLLDPEKSGDLSEAEKQKKTDELLKEQGELNRNIGEHADAMEQFSPNKPLYDMERSLQEQLNQRAGELRNSARKNEKVTRDSQNAGNMETALQQSREAADEQLETMRGSRQEQDESISDPLEDMAQMHELMKDFNHFQELYRQQQEIAEQSQPYDAGRPLDNADRMALQNLAAREDSVREQLEQLSEKLKEDAAAAEENFPKAAQSGKDLAGQIDQARLPELAQDSTSSMLKGKGRESAERSERLRREMENLMSQCQACQNGGQCMGDELDQYLTMNQMAPGNTFQQMMQSRLFGQGQGKPGLGMGGMGGMGMGTGGTGGRFGTTFSPNMGMLGGDSELGNMTGGKGDSRRNGPGTPGKTTATEDTAKADSLPEIKPATRQSQAVTPEILAEKYRGLVEEYFRALTRPKTAKPGPPPNP